MKYRRVGMWGLKLSEIGFGSWLTMNSDDQSVADSLHRTAFENGINFLRPLLDSNGGDSLAVALQMVQLDLAMGESEALREAEEISTKLLERHRKNALVQAHRAAVLSAQTAAP